MHCVLDVTDLAYRDGGRTRVADVGFSVERGAILGLLGTNGAGKSTTLAMLCGALAPTAGNVRVLGEDLYRGARELRRHIGYLPEQPALYPELTVLENLRFAARLRGIDRAALAPALARVTEACDLGDLGPRLARRLSRGEQQRVGLARALVHEPDLLILDEPTAGLDPVQAGALRELLRSLAADLAVVLSTHLLPDIETLCRSAVLLHRGRQLREVDLDTGDTDIEALFVSLATRDQLAATHADAD